MMGFPFKLSGTFAAVVLLVSSCSTQGGGDKASRQTGTTGPDSLSTALRELEQRIVADPSRAELYAERARLHLRADSTGQAINDWKRALALDSTNARYHLALGEAYYLSLQVAEALPRFERAIALDPGLSEAHLKLAEIQLVLRQYQLAMDAVNEALRTDANLARGYYLKGWIYKETGDTTRAISSMRTAVEQDPTFYDAFIQLGLLHAAIDDPLAIQYYNTALELRPRSVEALYNKGMYAQEHGQDSLALACYERIREIDPRNATAWYNAGWVRLEHLNDLEQAHADFDRAFRLLPGYYQAVFNRGLASERLGRLDSAAADYREALRLAPGFDLAALGLQRLADQGVDIDAP